MTQKYGDDKVFAPGTVIISAAGEVTDVKRTVSPVMQPKKSQFIYVDFSSDSLKLGGSALGQTMNRLGAEAPTVADAGRFAAAFNAVQRLVARGSVMAAHDVSVRRSGDYAPRNGFRQHQGWYRDVDRWLCRRLSEDDLVKILFAENPAVVLQVADDKVDKAMELLDKAGVKHIVIGRPAEERMLMINHRGEETMLGIDWLRDVWMRPSYLLDRCQSGEKQAASRFENYKKQPIRYRLPKGFDGKLASRGLTLGRHAKSGVRAAIIREKGVNGDREMAYSLYLAGFDVKDVHMTDLMSGRETLEDVNMIVFCGGFSNSDVLGSAKG